MENQIKGNTTATVFGNELHRYSIADGIRDRNVLGFDPYKVLTHKDRDVRKVVALHEAKAKDEEEAINDPIKNKVYYKFMDSSKVGMAGSTNAAGIYAKGVEDYLPSNQYKRNEHQEKVVEDILAGWLTLSHAGKFHALFATSSIPEAIIYYRLIKEAKPELKITALFDPTIDNGEGATTEFKENGLIEIINDYNARYGQNFEVGTHNKFKKDIAARLAHKDPYKRLESEPENQIDLLIVVDQMLTGFDSKWINTLYMDKLLEYQNIIQAFSRTNRLFGHEKPFGTIRYYRKPHTMERNIEEAVKLYSGDKPIGLFAQRLEENLNAMNELYDDIKKVFEGAGVSDFTKNPDDKTSCGKFASLFRKLNEYLEAAKIQGFKWEEQEYVFQEKPRAQKTIVEMTFDENIYLILALRYKELFAGGNGGCDGDVPFEIDGHLTEIDTGKIDADYMNSRFEKYLKLMNLDPKPSSELVDQALDDLHKTFATLTQDEQKYAGIFLRDIERGDVFVEEGKTLRDYITEYQVRAKNDQIHRVADVLGMNEPKLREMMNLKLTEANINEYGRFDNLKDTVDRAKARTYFERKQGAKILPFKVSNLIDEFLRKFLLEGGFDVEGEADEPIGIGYDYNEPRELPKVAEEAEDVYKA
jgi:type I restriction enzyme R subunit